MPLTPTHALVPVAWAVAFANRPFNLRILGAAMVAAALPDIDAATRMVMHHLPPDHATALDHRGLTHSLFLALGIGAVAAAFHHWLRVRRLTAFVVLAAAMASHGLLDMLTTSGLPVAYLWPVSSVRLFADWRPIQTQDVTTLADLLTRMRAEVISLILPTFAIAFAVRLARHAGRPRQAALS